MMSHFNIYTYLHQYMQYVEIYKMNLTNVGEHQGDDGEEATMGR
jgi:hypothetical protein